MPRNADYTHMRCRYCGKELALLKRLTGGGEFCSEAHKQSYQDEYNRLALSRLLQAQKHGQAEPTGKAAAAPPSAPVAVEEPMQEESGMEESLVASAHSTQVLEPEPEPAEITDLEESAVEEETFEEPPGEPEPTELAEFLVDVPGMAALPSETPYLEAWLELTSGPAVADLQLQNGAFELSSGALLALDLQLHASAGKDIEQSAAQARLTPEEFTNLPGRPSMPWKVSTMRQLPTAGPVFLGVAAISTDFVADENTGRGLDFEAAVLMEDSRLLRLPSTAIEFPSEDSAVLVTGAEQDGLATRDVAEVTEDASPRASLEALSKLHQDLIHEDEEQPELKQTELKQPALPVVEAEPVVIAVPVEAVEVTPEIVREVTPEIVTEVTPEIVIEITTEPTSEISDESPAEPLPGIATELMDVAVRMFPPAKPAPIAGVGLPNQTEALLPRLKGLPLRPKVAVAFGYVPPSEAAAHPRTSASATKVAPVQSQTAAKEHAVPAKTVAPARPSGRISQPKQPPAPSKASASEPVKPAGKFHPPSPAAAPKTAPPAPARPETVAAKTDTPKKAAAEPALNSPAEKVAPNIAASATVPVQPSKPPVEQSSKDDSKPTPKPDPQPEVKSKAGESSGQSAPNFGAIQLPNASFAGSLKVKLGIAIAFLVIACSTWLGWGGRSAKSASSNGALSADGSGPSIIMGEGGWVEGWGGDPTGIHAGRQITIYRPSIKLSDYRIEFEGTIETQSIGWVFRAADPQNYYAMKLMAASSGLLPKVALFKYLVINGRQTQVGRVPIDMTLRTDTVFNVRTDVRGPQFSTYIQGRQVDVWTDDQLKVGGVGFLNERDERGKVKSVSIRYLNAAK